MRWMGPWCLPHEAAVRIRESLSVTPITVPGYGVCLLDVSTGLCRPQQGERRLRDWFLFFPAHFRMTLGWNWMGYSLELPDS